MQVFHNTKNRIGNKSSAQPICSAIIVVIIFFYSDSSKAIPLSSHIKRFTSVLSHRNLDSLRLLIDPSRIFVEITPKTGSFLSPSQTLAVIEFFFVSHPPVSFSYTLVKEENKTGIALGTLIVVEGGRNISHKTSFGFQKDSRGNWTLSRIFIR